MPGLAHHPIDNLEPPAGFTQGCDDTHGCFRHPVAAAWGVSGGSQLELERLESWRARHETRSNGTREGRTEEMVRR